MIVGSAEVTVTPDSKGFGPKTKAQIEKALAGLDAKIELTLDDNHLRTKVRAAIQAATSGAEVKIGTSLDTSPLKGKIAKALSEAAAEAGGDAQLDIFDIDPARLAAEVLEAKEAARLALAAGTQLELGLDFDTPALAAKLATEVTAAVEAANAAAKAASGNLELEIHVNETALAAEVAAASAAASAAAAAIEAKFNIDPLEVVSKVEAAMSAAQAAVGDIEFDLDFPNQAAAATKANALVSEISASLPGLDIEADLDSDGLRTEVTAAIAEAQAGQKVKVPIDIQGGGGGAGGDAEKVGAAAGGIFGRAVLRTALRVLAAGALIQLFTAATSGAVALAGGLTSATAAAGSLVATVGALPGLLSAAAQAAGVVALSLGGIGVALKAFVAEQKAIGAEIAGGGSGAGGASAASIRAAERAIRNASQGVEDAQRQTADAVESANERIADSARGVIDAQLNLQETYEGAAEAIEAANKRVADSAKAVADAQENLVDAQRVAAESIQSANERVTDSIAGVADAQERLTETYEASARRVSDAERDVARSHRNVQDAQEALTKARADAREEVEDLRRSIARLSLTEDEARRRLAEAQTKRDLARKRAQQDLTGVTEETLRALERQEALEDKAAENPQAKADNDLRDAELDLQEAMDDRSKAQTKLAEADRNGIENTKSVIDARDRLADSEERLQESIAASARAQRDAARDNAAALERVADAQKRVSDATTAAARSQVEAARRIADAQDRVVDAQDRVVEATRDQVRAQRDAARDIADAQRRVSDSMRDSERAQRDLVRAQEDGARRIADAQENLADAIASAAERAESATGGAAGAINRYQAALDALGPSQRRFVEFLVGLQPRLKAIQETAAAGLLPGFEDAIRTALPLLDDFEPLIGRTGEALGELARKAATLATTPGWRRDLVDIGTRNISILETIGDAALRGANLLKNITVTAGPLASHLADLVNHFARLADEVVAVAREDGRLTAFFDRTQGRLDKVVVAAQALATGLGRIFRDAMPEGDRYLDLLTRVAVKFDLLTDLASKSGALGEFFESAREPLAAASRLIEDLVTGLAKVGIDNLPGLTALIEQLRTELLPILLAVVGTIDANFLSAIVSLVGSASELFGVLLTGNPALTLFVEVLGDMADVMSVLLRDIPILSPILQGLVTVLGALSVIGAVSALRQFASSAFGVQKALVTMTGAADEAAFAATRTGRAAAVAGDLLGKAFVAVGLVVAYREAVEAIAPSVDKVVDAVIRSKDPLRTFEDGLRNLAHPSVIDRIKLGLKEITDFNFANPVQAVRALQAAITGMGDKGSEAFTKLAKSSQSTALRIIADAKAQGKETGEYERILESLIQEKAHQSVAEETVNRRVQEQIDKLKGVNSELDRHVEKVRAATDAELKMSGAQIAVEEALDNMTRSLEENGNTFDIHEQKGRSNKRALDDLISSIEREIEVGGITNDRKRELIGYLSTLENSGYPGAQGAANRLRQELEQFQTVYTATVDLDTDAAQRKLIQLQREIAAVEFSERPEGDPSHQGGTQAREFGGRVLRNAAYVVGERRPELFIPDRNGIIVPDVPPLAVPTGLDSVERSIAMPGNDQMDALLDRLDSFTEVLTDRLVDQQEARDRFGVDTQPAPVEQNDVTINGPLVTIEQTFGPGAAVNDIIAAMRAVADEEVAKVLAQVLQHYAAGAGTRGTP